MRLDLQLQYWICFCEEEAAFKADLKIHIQGAYLLNASVFLFVSKTRRLHIKHTPVFMTKTSVLF